MYRLSLLIFVLVTFAANGALIQSEDAQYGFESFLEPYQTIEVAVSEPGRIAEVNVQRGSRVGPDDVLFELDHSVLEASLRVAQQVATSTARLDALKITLAQKRHRYETLKALSREGAGTPDELISAESELRIAELNVQAAVEEQTERQLEVKEIQTRIDLRKIRTQVTGIVVDVHKHVDEYVSVSDPKVATVIDIEKLRTSFYLPTEVAETLVNTHSVTVEVLPKRTLITGEIEFLGPTTMAGSDRVRLDVVFDNSQGNLRSGRRCQLVR